MSPLRAWLLVFCLIASWGVWLAWLTATHGPGYPGALSEPWQEVEAWQVSRGAAWGDGSSLAIAKLDSSGEFLAVAQTRFDAEQGALLRLRAQNYPLNYVLMLAWKRADGEQVYFTRLQVPDGGSQSSLMPRQSDWQGVITELVLYGYPQPQTSPPVVLDKPVIFDTVVWAGDSWLGRLDALWTGWTALDPWAMLSVSSLGRYPDLDEGIGLNAAVGGAAVITLALVCLLGGLRREYWAGAALTVLLGATVLLQLQSSRSLFAQVSETRHRLAGLSPEERRRFQFDRDLVDLAALAQPKIQPRDRVHVVTDDRFFNLRAAWHLRPANVSTFYLPPAEPGAALRPGDLVFLYRQPGLTEPVSRGLLTLGSQTWRVLPLATGSGGAMVRLLDRKS
ncbi:MAG: hypothetical protein AAF552_08290 [Pseudomonadota bacterium]